MPKIGARNLKTALSVFTCLLIFQLLNREYPFYACIAAVICMQKSVENSFETGRKRMIGTIIGGIVGYIFSSITGYSDTFMMYNSIFCGIGIVLVIHLCNISGQKGSVAISCIVFIAIMTNLKGTEPMVYAVNRVIDTFIGIIVSIMINKFVNLDKFVSENNTRLKNRFN